MARAGHFSGPPQIGPSVGRATRVRVDTFVLVRAPDPSSGEREGGSDEDHRFEADRCRYFDTAHGSALECASGLDVLVAKGRATPDQIRPGKERLQKIVRMLMGLIKRNSTRDYEKGKPPGEAEASP